MKVFIAFIYFVVPASAVTAAVQGKQEAKPKTPKASLVESAKTGAGTKAKTVVSLKKKKNQGPEGRSAFDTLSTYKREIYTQKRSGARADAVGLAAYENFFRSSDKLKAWDQNLQAYKANKKAENEAMVAASKKRKDQMIKAAYKANYIFGHERATRAATRMANEIEKGVSSRSASGRMQRMSENATANAILATVIAKGEVDKFEKNVQKVPDMLRTVIKNQDDKFVTGAWKAAEPLGHDVANVVSTATAEQLKDIDRGQIAHDAAWLGIQAAAPIKKEADRREIQAAYDAGLVFNRPGEEAK